MAKRGRQKNRTGNSKRPPAPSLEGAAATKLPSVNPGPLLASADAGDVKPSAKLQLVPNESAPPPALADSVPPSSAASSDAPPSLEAAPVDSPKDGTPSPISLDLANAPVEVDEFEEAFFSSLPPSMHAADAHDDHEEADARMARLHEPEVVARRDRMRRRVAWGLAACAAVFFVAVGREALHSHESTPARTQAVAPDPQPVAVAPAEPSAPIAVAPIAKVEEPAPVVSAAPEAVAPPAPSAEPPPVVSAAPVVAAAPVVSAAPAVEAAPEPAAAPVVAAAGGDAKALRSQAQKLLESGKANDAIPVALESTTMEPEHAGGWLLLGAAYQTRGRNAEARQAFLTCVKTAKRGPRGECAAMLR